MDTNKRIQTPFTQAEYAEVEAFAKVSGMRLNAWVHKTLLDAARGARPITQNRVETTQNPTQTQRAGDEIGALRADIEAMQARFSKTESMVNMVDGNIRLVIGDIDDIESALKGLAEHRHDEDGKVVLRDRIAERELLERDETYTGDIEREEKQ